MQHACKCHKRRFLYPSTQMICYLCATRTVGGVHTAHHSVALKVKSALDCLPDEDELMPEAALEHQNSTLTQTTADSDVFETQSRPPPLKACNCIMQFCHSVVKMEHAVTCLLTNVSGV